MLQDLLVRSVAQRDGIKVVLLHELVEEVGAEHHRLRNHHLRLFILIKFRVALDDIIEKRQTTALTTEGTLTDTGKVGIAVEFQTVEDSHNTDVLHPTVLYDGVEDDLTVGINILQLMPGDVLEESRHGEDGTGTEPAAHVITTDMAHQ